MSATGRSDVRQADDFYSTPAWCVRAILPYLPRDGAVLDPCAGDGAILDVLATSQPQRERRGIEINEKRAAVARASHVVVCADALAELTWTEILLSTSCEQAPGLVLTNPPYALAEEFLCRALCEVGYGADGILRGTIALLLRINWLASKGRAWMHRRHPSDLFVLPRRPSFTGKGTDATEYAWFVWGPWRGGRWSILDVESGRAS